MMQLKLHTITIEDMVPADHFVRKLDAALDLSFVWEETSGRLIATDSTHVKANASRASEYLKDVEEEPGAYLNPA